MNRGVEDSGERDDTDGGGDEGEQTGGDRDAFSHAPEVGESVGERFALAPVTQTPVGAKQDKIVFIVNFFDELRRIAPVTKR